MTSSLWKEMLESGRERKRAMLALEAKGLTHEEIGKEFGLSRQRVGQILKSRGKKRGRPGGTK